MFWNDPGRLHRPPFPFIFILFGVLSNVWCAAALHSIQWRVGVIRSFRFLSLVLRLGEWVLSSFKCHQFGTRNRRGNILVCVGSFLWWYRSYLKVFINELFCHFQRPSARLSYVKDPTRLHSPSFLLLSSFLFNKVGHASLVMHSTRRSYSDSTARFWRKGTRQVKFWRPACVKDRLIRLPWAQSVVFGRKQADQVRSLHDAFLSTFLWTHRRFVIQRHSAAP